MPSIINVMTPGLDSSPFLVSQQMLMGFIKGLAPWRVALQTSCIIIYIF